MKSVRWSLRGGEFDLREAARAAAHRAGVSLGQWLEDAIAAGAARLGVEPGELTNTQKIDAIAQRLGALTLDEPDANPRLRADNDHAPPPVRRDADISLLDAAAARLGLGRPDDTDHRLRHMADALREERDAPILNPPPRRKSGASETELRALREQIEQLSNAVAVISERAERHGLEPALLDLLHRIEASRAEGVREEALAPVLDMLIDMREALEHAPAIVSRTLRAELEHLHSRLDAMQTGAEVPRIEALRHDVQDLARELADVAMRLGAQDDLQRQLANLMRRVEEIAAAPRELAAHLIALAERLRDSVEQLDASPGFRALWGRVEDVAAQQAEAYPGFAASLDDMRHAVAALADHPAFAEMHGQLEQLKEMTGALPGQLVEALDDMRLSIERLAANPALAAERAAPLPGHVAEGLAEIRLAIERLAANAGLRLAEENAVRLQTIEERVGEIARKLDTPPAAHLSSLEEKLLASLERLRADIVVAKPAPQSDAPASLEAIVTQLASKLERAASAGAQDPRALQAIENQVLRIAERLDRHGEMSEALTALERGMSELSAQVDETRHVAREAASAHARGGDGETERQTRATLDAVHETLEKVVDRLALLEGDLGALRAKKSEPPHAPEPPRGEPKSPPKIPVVEPPAAARPQATTAPAAPSAQNMAVELSEPKAAQMSFIAAARRATQLMSGGPRPPARVDDQATRATPGAQEPHLGPFGARKIVLGVAGLALALGAYQLTNEAPLETPPAAQAEAPPSAEPPKLSVRAEEIPAASAPEQIALSSEPPAAATPPTDPTPVASIKSEPGASTLNQLAAGGNAAAQHELGARLVEGRGVARDVAQGATWLRKSAEQNYAPAQYRLGALYERGTGVPRSLKEAAAWYAKAADAGHVRAAHNYGVLLADGVEGRPNYTAAASFFRRAAQHGVADSQFNLGMLHERGLGVPLDLIEAYKWYSLAGDQGDLEAIAKRDDLAGRLQPLQIEEARKAAQAFALRAPDPAANEPPAMDMLMDPAQPGVRTTGAERVSRLAR